MIVKMKFLSITGPRADIDRMTNRYLSKYEMQLENALTELKTVDNLMPFLEMNPYRDPLAKVTQFLGYMKDMPAEPSFDQSEDEILEMIRSINHDYMDLQKEKEELKKKRENIQARMKVLEPFTSLDFDLHEIMQYKYIRTRFGKINVDYYHRLEKRFLKTLMHYFWKAPEMPLMSMAFILYRMLMQERSIRSCGLSTLKKSICWKTLAELRWKLTGAWIKKSRI